MKWHVTVVGGNVRLYFKEHYWVEFRLSEKARVEQIASLHNLEIVRSACRAANDKEIETMMRGVKRW